jgi:hypothetical protein
LAISTITAKALIDQSIELALIPDLMLSISARSFLLTAFLLAPLSASMPCFAINQSTALPQIFCKSMHLEDINQVIDQYKTWSELKTYPKNLAENSSAQLFDSTAAFAKAFKTKSADLQDIPSSWKGKELSLNQKIPKKWLGFWVLHAAVEKALLVQGIPLEASYEMGILAQQSLAEAQGENWTQYREQINEIFARSIIPEAKDMHLDQTFQTLLRSVKVDHTFQIPYLAGYAKSDAHQIYIDSGVKPQYQTPDGPIDVSQDLSIHEFVEKSLIDWAPLTEKVYLRTHQIAQRMEKAMVENFGFSWAFYQGKLMQAEIYRADEIGRSDATLVRVPKDLDLTPYIDFEEWDMISRMKKAYQ